jgi:4-hydroxybenzoate polyprenyltransferase
MIKVQEASRWIVFGNFWVAACAALMYAASVLSLAEPFQWRWFFIIFFATVAAYNYHRVPASSLAYYAQGSDRHQWIRDNRKAIIGLLLVSFLIAGLLLFPAIELQMLYWFIPAGVFSLLYVLPVLPVGGKWTRLRDLPFVKTFVISAVWAVITVVPASKEALLFDCISPELLWLMAERFLFLTAISIPFDLRDLTIDAQNKVKTFAGIWGFERTLLYCRALLVIFAVLALIGFQLNLFSGPTTLAMIISAASSGWLIAQINEQSTEMIYGFWLEGTMIDQFFWIFLLSLI